MQALLDGGAEVNAIDNWGHTALMWACGYGARPVPPAASLAGVRLLLGHGADAAHAAADRDTALIEASRTGSTGAVRCLLEQGGIDVDATNIHGETALLLAAAEGHTQAALLLLDCGADAQHVDLYQDTALLNAAGNEHEDTLRLLLARGADPDMPNGIGQTALVTALSFERVRVLAILLKGGANPNLPDAQGVAPLMLALDDKEAVRLLLAHGADVAVRDDRGITVLQQAIADCCHNSIPLLKAAGAQE